MNEGKKTLRDESTTKGREVWKAVDSAVERAPGWIRKRIAKIDIEKARMEKQATD